MAKISITMLKDKIIDKRRPEKSADDTEMAKQPEAVPADMESFRPRIAALDPDALVNLVMDLAQNITTDELESALAMYEGETTEETPAPEAGPAGGMGGM